MTLKHRNCHTPVTIRRRHIEGTDERIERDRTEMALWCPTCELFIAQDQTTYPSGPICLVQRQDLHVGTDLL